MLAHEYDLSAKFIWGPFSSISTSHISNRLSITVLFTTASSYPISSLFLSPPHNDSELTKMSFVTKYLGTQYMS